MPDQLNVGDTVQLKSGGPMMTIERIEQSTGGHMTATCLWFNDQRSGFETNVFRIELLAPA